MEKALCSIFNSKQVLQQKLLTHFSSHAINHDSRYICSDQLNEAHHNSRLIWMKLSSRFGKYFRCVADHTEYTTKIHNQQNHNSDDHRLTSCNKKRSAKCQLLKNYCFFNFKILPKSLMVTLGLSFWPATRFSCSNISL